MHLLLAFVLLLGQQAAFAHAVTHLGSAPASQDKQLPHGKACDQCVQGAQLGAALLDGGSQPAWSGAPENCVAFFANSVCLPRLLPSFHSRAPPASL
jgi:hypothetical protein